MRARLIEQAPRAFDVGPHKGSRILNRAVHMSLGRKVHYNIRPMLPEDLFDVAVLGNVATNKLVSGVVCDFGEVAQISRIRQQIEVHDLDAFSRFKSVADETGADKTGPARH